jgi:phospholipase A1
MRAVHGVVTLLATILATSGAARGAEPVWTLFAPPTVRALSVVRIDVVGLNPGFGEVLSVEPEPTLSATFRTATAEYPVALLAASDAVPMTVEPRSFATRTYFLTVPDAPEGEATLSVTVGGREVAAALRVAIDAAPPPREPIPTTAAVLAFPRTHPDRLSLYMPNYFVYGAGGEPEAKFQFSLKYRLLTFGKGKPDRPPASLQLAYTQRSLWDMGKPSEPFYDTSYMPEVFVDSLAPQREHWGSFSFLGWSSGWRHESNGRDGDDSRAWDIAFARVGFAFGSPERWYLAVAPEIWQRLGPADHMPDIEEYRGRGRIFSVAGYGSGPSLASSLTPDQDFQHLSYQLDLYVPITLSRLGFASYFVVQYFDGYAESIRNYTHESQSLRVGFSLVR